MKIANPRRIVNAQQTAALTALATLRKRYQEHAVVFACDGQAASLQFADDAAARARVDSEVRGEAVDVPCAAGEFISDGMAD